MLKSSMKEAALNRPVWRTSSFVVAHAVAGLMIISWLVVPTSGWWSALDESAFRLLNGILEDAKGQQVFWALANHRSVDLLSGTLAAFVVVWWIWGQPRNVQHWRCAMLAAIAIPVIIIPFVAHEVLEQVLHFERPSPTMVHEDAQRLTQLIPTLATKDASRYSFPGDHAFVLFSVIFFYAYFNARKCLLVSVLMAVVFMLPRLIAGAHWLTDNIIGGAAPALLVTAWVLATPIGYYFAKALLPVVRFIFGLLPPFLRIPEGSASSQDRA